MQMEIGMLIKVLKNLLNLLGLIHLNNKFLVVEMAVERSCTGQKYARAPGKFFQRRT